MSTSNAARNAAAQLYVLKKNGLYWRSNARGYSEGILYAGTYSDKESAKYVGGSSGEVTRVPLLEAMRDALGSCETIDPVVLRLALERMRPPVDCAQCYTAIRKFIKEGEAWHRCVDCDGALCEKCCEAVKSAPAIYAFRCACGSTWTCAKASTPEARGHCAACRAPITEGMENDAVLLWRRSDGP